MDKLSSILPASPRVQSVDLTDAQPVRPGTPTFGRPVGVSTVKDRFTVSQQAKDVAFKDSLGAINPKEARGVKIAEDMTKKFFESRIAPEVKVGPGSEQTAQHELEVEDSLPRAVGPVQLEEPAQASAPAKEPASSGRRLDVEA